MYRDVSIIDIQVLNKYGVGDIEYLLIALEWCVRHGIKLIHISLCTCNYHDYYRLLPVINQLIKGQCFLVAAMDNRNIISFPASMQGVYGVFQDCCTSFLLLKQRGYQCEIFSDLIFDESVIPIELYCGDFNLLDAKILADLEKIYKPDLIIMYHNINKCKQQTLNDAADLVVWREYPYIMVKDSNGIKVYDSKEDLCNALPHYFD